MTNTTNLAVQHNERADNLAYVDFAAFADARKKAGQKRALCLQHRYGFCIVLLCAIAFLVGMTTACTDMTALLVLVPLGIYLMLTKQVLLYQPQRYRL